MSVQDWFVAEWNEALLEGRIDRRTLMRRLAAIGLAAPAAGLAAMPRTAHADDPTTLLIATPEVPPGLDTEYNGSRSAHEGIAQTVDTLVAFDKKTAEDGLLYLRLQQPQGGTGRILDA